MAKATAIIPARYASSRFPGKPLALLSGKPMIQHVCERVSKADGVGRVIVATDDQRIFDAVTAFGGEVVMTRDDHPTGTDRLAEVASRIDADLIVNVQGDEPLVDPRMVDEAVAPMLQDDSILMGTVAARIDDIEDFYNPNVVKVVRDLNNFAMYFSRAAIPCPRDMDRRQLSAFLPSSQYLRHIGLYVYRRQLLLDYPTWPKTPLETLENLEQLRALERGIRLYVAETGFNCHGVDTPEDLMRVERLIKG